MKKTIKFKKILKIQIKNPKVNNKIKYTSPDNFAIPINNNKIKYTSPDNFAIPINSNKINISKNISKNILNSNINSNKIIIHVYNSNYGYGLGDFIRGSILLAQYAKYYNINFKIDVSRHTIAKYLNNETQMLTRNIKVKKIINQNYRDDKNIFYTLIQKFMNSNKTNLYIQTNVLYNKKHLTNDIKDYINSFFTFKPQYYDTVEELFKLNNYNILHIRCLDRDFNTNFKDKNLLLKIKKIKSTDNTYIMSNNYELKKRLNNTFGFHFIDNKAFHCAKIKCIEDLESTIIDYIILSKSSNTYCISYYRHGSGFSEHCSALNNIPYTRIK